MAKTSKLTATEVITRQNNKSGYINHKDIIKAKVIMNKLFYPKYPLENKRTIVFSYDVSKPIEAIYAVIGIITDHNIDFLKANTPKTKNNRKKA